MEKAGADGSGEGRRTAGMATRITITDTTTIMGTANIMAGIGTAAGPTGCLTTASFAWWCSL
jgi:hypothetical protein